MESKTAMDRASRLDCLRLIRSENVGPITYRRLLDRFGTAAAALEALPELARRGGKRGGAGVFPQARAAAELERLEAAGGRLLVRGEADYPALLAGVEDGPPVLSILGHGHVLAGAAIAIVGARSASTNGCLLARRFARAFGVGGYRVVSGMARGIDAAAHDGALDSGTIAVLAGGVDHVYPQENRQIYDAMRERGVIVSEMPFSAQPQARHFPRRNRIISGLALATLVVEAAPRSGSLITARLAMEQGREVFAVPGSPLDGRARGCNDLIRKGAVLAETPDDVLSGIAQSQVPVVQEPGDGTLFSARPAGLPAAGRDDERIRVRMLERLGPTPCLMDDLFRDLDLPVSVASAALLELEISGRVKRFTGGRVAAVQPAGGDDDPE